MITAMILATVLQAEPSWSVRTFGDEMTDTSALVASVNIGLEALAVRCMSGEPVVFRLSQTVIGSDRPVVFRRSFSPAYRVDDGDPSSAQWIYDDNGGTLMRDDARAFIAAVTPKSKSVLTRLITWDHETVDQRFPLEGAADAIATATESCAHPPE